MRVGIGYDIHCFDEGGTLVLGGVQFLSFPALKGHSDGDVVLHAVADSLLGAAAMGDIGEHFPDDSERWENVDSSDLLRDAGRLLKNRAYIIGNIDVNIICQKPKIGDKKRIMRSSIAEMLEIPEGAVNIKARTKEGLDAVGAGRAIEAQSVALITKKP